MARWYGYGVWLDDALPEDVQERYREANRRFTSQVALLVDAPPRDDFAFYRNAGSQFTLAEMIDEVLAAEEEVRSTGELAPVESEID